jgi:hypothetical protein
MPVISIQRDPANISQAEHHKIDGQINLLEWLCANVEHNMNDLHCAFYLNQKELCNTWDYDHEKCNELLDIEIGLLDQVVLVVRPAGVDPFTAAIIVAIAVTAAVVVASLIPKVPDQIDTGDPTSNNQLNTASNSFRPRQAIPDIAGQVVAYPDFAQRSYYYYESNRRVFVEVFCVSIGHIEASTDDVKEGDTPFSDIGGYKAEFFGPNEHPSTLLNVYTNPSTQDVDLLSPDQQTKSAYVDSGSVIGLTGRVTVGAEIMEQLALAVGNNVEINIEASSIDSGTFEVNGSYVVTAVDENYFEVVSDWSEAGSIQSGYIANTDYSSTAPWYFIGSAQRIWFSVKMPSGIRKGDGTDASVNFRFTAELLDEDGEPTGTTLVREGSFFGNTQEAQYQTFEMNADIFGSVKKFRAKAERLSSYLGDNSIDLLTLDAISAVQDYAPNFGNVTILKVERRSVQRINRGGSEKINCLVTRKLRIFDNETKTYGTDYVATRSFADYAFYLLHERMGVAIENINTDDLFGIKENLSDAQLGYFDWTFDDKSVGARDRLELICNVARVRYWNEGLNWSFTREELKPVRQLMFNRRNLKSASAQYVQRFRQPSNFDGVTIKYVDPVKNAQVEIHKRIVGTSFVDGQGNEPYEIELSGCRNLLQAQNRLELEVRRLIYQNIRVTDTALNDALLCRLGYRVDWVDMYDSDLFSGEIIGIDGNAYKTSERFTPKPGVDYYVYVTDDEGNPSNSVIATARSDGNLFGFEAYGLSGVFLSGGVVQLGSRYFIASNDDLDASAFTVIGRGRPNEMGECEIELAEYNPLMFEAD